MIGFVIVDKPSGWTSQDVVSRMRKLFGMHDVGHGGTLDPMATGVLPVFLGRATRASVYVLEGDKTYAARLRFGITTDSQDITGTVLSTSAAFPTLEAIADVLPRFRGKILQTPPMYSAVQIGGKRLYELARKGIEVERPSREITIHSLELLSPNEPSPFGTAPEAGEADVLVTCSKGTYIRTLAADIGDACGCGAVLAGLRRLNSHGFDIGESYTLDRLAEMRENGTLGTAVCPVDRLFADLPVLKLDAYADARIRRGAPVYLHKKPGKYRLYGIENEFLGIGNVRETDRRPELMIEKGFFEV